MTINFCNGRYKLDVIPVAGNTTMSGYIQFVRERPNKTERNALCSEYLLKQMPKGISVVEHFGGAGLLGVMVEKLLEPSSHLLFDIDPDCVEQLKHVFGEDKVQRGDAKEVMGTIPADYIALDFNWFNLFHEAEWEEGLKRVFAQKPQFVTIADVANQRMGIHRDLYARKLGRDVKNNQDYITGMSEHFYGKYGYSVRSAAYHIFSFMLLTPGETSDIDFWDVRKHRDN